MEGRGAVHGLVELELGDDDGWDLVDFVRSEGDAATDVCGEPLATAEIPTVETNTWRRGCEFISPESGGRSNEDVHIESERREKTITSCRDELICKASESH